MTPGRPSALRPVGTSVQGSGHAWSSKVNTLDTLDSTRRCKHGETDAADMLISEQSVSEEGMKRLHGELRTDTATALRKNNANSIKESIQHEPESGYECRTVPIKRIEM